MITTHDITLDQRKFFRILLLVNIPRKTWMLYGLALVLAVVWIVCIPYQSQIYLLLAAVTIFPLLVIFLTWRTSRNEMNSRFMTPRRYAIEKGLLTAHLSGEQTETFDIARPSRVIRTKAYYLLFTGRGEFIYLPMTAFRSAEDQAWFEREVVARAKRKR